MVPAETVPFNPAGIEGNALPGGEGPLFLGTLPRIKIYGHGDPEIDPQFAPSQILDAQGEIINGLQSLFSSTGRRYGRQ